ncbi:Cubilin [Halotydeus destructor]|nr:Cubilin [Halotydeus destructor]
MLHCHPSFQHPNSARCPSVSPNTLQVGPLLKASPFSPVITQGEPSITSDQSSSMGVSSSITVIDGPKSGRVPCDLAIYDSIFEVSSPGYPYGYPLNSDCLYSIRKLNDNVCKLRLTFVDFDLETTPACDHDYLQVNGDNICGRYGNGTVKDYDFTSHKMALRFMSDNRGTKKGFFIKGQQVMGDECNIHKAGLYGNQRSAPASPAYPPYEAPKASSYPPGVSSNSGQSAFGTFVQLPPPSEQSNQYPFMNSFPVAPSCDKLINDTFFDIKSPQYPMRYESGSKCVYTIRKAHDNICYLDIVFGHFDVGDTRFGTCDKSDYVSVEGEKFCGHLQRERMQTFPFQGGEKTILFMGHSGTGQGFHIRGRQIECNRFMSSSSSSRFTHSRALKADSQLNATLTINISDDGTKLRKLNVVKKSIGDDHGRQDGVSRVGRLLLPIRAQLEQIVETQVRVVDNKDGLYSFISNMSNSTHNHQ